MRIPKGFRRLGGTERRMPHGARRVGSARADEIIDVTIHLRRHPAAPPLPDQQFWMATPPSRRSYLTREQFAGRYGAAEEDIDVIERFAEARGLAVIEADPIHRTVIVSGAVKQMGRAFGVDLGQYRRGDESYRGREGYIYLPHEIVDVVQGVFGLDNRRMAYRQSVRGHGSSLSPARVARLYAFPSPPAGITQQTIGLLEFCDPAGIGACGYLPSDIGEYFSGKLSGHSTPVRPRIVDVVVNGPGNRPGGANDPEVAMDIEVAGAIAQGAKLAVYFATWDENGWLRAIKRAIHPRPDDPIPTVLSISWLAVEFGRAPQLEWSRAAMEAIGAMFQEAAALGLTVFAASGDLGTDCQQADGRAHVYYPASDPWVTCCGGTAIEVTSASFVETTWSENGSTGGGVSAYFDLPPWQGAAGVVPRSVNPGARVGRGIPDIAGYANGYTIVHGGTRQGPARGTSEVAPLYAGLIAIINAALGHPVGYLNPTLYSLAGGKVFRDICDGATNSFNGAPGYAATQGWDACTGWGSVDGAALLEALRNT